MHLLAFSLAGGALLAACSSTSQGDPSLADAALLGDAAATTDASPLVDAAPAACTGAAGRVQWARALPNVHPFVVRALADRYVVAGWLGGTVDLDGTVLAADGTYNDLVIVVFELDGQVRWARKLATCQAVGPADVAVLANGDIVVVGGAFATGPGCSPMFAGDVHVEPWGGGAGQGVFMARWSQDGEELAFREWGSGIAPDPLQGVNNTFTRLVVLPGDSEAIVTGTSVVPVAIGGQSLTGGWAARIPLDGGDATWARPLAVTPHGAVLAGDNVVLAGSFAATVQLAAGMELVSAGGRDLALFTLDVATGQVVWGQRYGGTGDEHAGSRYGYGGLVQHEGGLRLWGRFVGEAHFGTLVATATDAEDTFVTSFAADGTPLSLTRLGEPGVDYFGDLALLADGDVILVGNNDVRVERFHAGESSWRVPLVTIDEEKPLRAQLDTLAISPDGQTMLAAGLGFGPGFVVANLPPFAIVGWSGIFVKLATCADGVVVD